jgi:hypothetical protein
VARYKPIQQTSPVKAIREFCIECMGGRETGQNYSKLIRECSVQSCPVYNFRFGKNPFHKKQITDQQKKQKADQLKYSASADKISKEKGEISPVIGRMYPNHT